MDGYPKMLGKCTHCNSTWDRLELRPIPETEQYVTKFLKGEATVEGFSELDLDTLLCPNCLEKLTTT